MARTAAQTNSATNRWCQRGADGVTMAAADEDLFGVILMTSRGPSGLGLLQASGALDSTVLFISQYATFSLTPRFSAVMTEPRAVLNPFKGFDPS